MLKSQHSELRRLASAPARRLGLQCLHNSQRLVSSRSVAPTFSSEPATYYNFKTLRQFPDGPPLGGVFSSATESDSRSTGTATEASSSTSGSSSRPATRLYMSHRSGTSDGLPLHNTSPPRRGDENDSDPYGHMRIFRRDMAEGGYSSNSSRPVPLSVDVSLKRFNDLFCDYDAKRCKLCNETFLQWYSHQSSVPHAARECLALELVRANCGSPEDIVKMWWHRLDTSHSFHRIPSLSHANSHIRKRRLQFLLKYLKDRDIIREAFNVRQQPSSAGRTWEFERLEFLGDNVIKYLFNNRIACLFPVCEGGTRGKIGLVQFLIDGNDGLARAHDFLELQQLTLSDRVVSKFKSDVVETLFGELQVFLWSSQLDLGTEKVPHPFTKGMLVLRHLVHHVMEELAHVMIMYHIEYVLGSVQRITREHQLQFPHADPLPSNAGGKGGGSFRVGSGAFSAATAQKSPGLSLTAKKAPYRGNGGAVSPLASPHTPYSSHHSHDNSSGHDGGEAGGASVYWEAMNYDKFAHVTPLGGLLPRPFRPSELAPVPTYMPHLQPDAQLTDRLPEDIAREVGAAMAITTNEEDSDVDVNAVEQPETLHLSVSSERRGPHARHPQLSVAHLKDAELVAELL